MVNVSARVSHSFSWSIVRSQSAENQPKCQLSSSKTSFLEGSFVRFIVQNHAAFPQSLSLSVRFFLISNVTSLRCWNLIQGVSRELGDPPSAVGTLSSLVGYSIRLESNTSRNTRLAFVTNGIALRMLEGGTGQGGQGTAFDEITVCHWPLT